MSKGLDVVVEALAMQSLDRVHDRRVDGASPGMEQTLVRDLVRQRMLEGELQIGEQPSLVEEPGSREAGHPAPRLVGRLVRHDAALV